MVNVVLNAPYLGLNGPLFCPYQTLSLGISLRFLLAENWWMQIKPCICTHAAAYSYLDLVPKMVCLEHYINISTFTSVCLFVHTYCICHTSLFYHVHSSSYFIRPLLQLGCFGEIRISNLIQRQTNIVFCKLPFFKILFEPV